MTLRPHSGSDSKPRIGGASRIIPPRVLILLRLPRLFIFLVVLAISTTGTLPASDAPSQALEALSILRSECLGCHNPEKKKGGLDMTTRQSLLSGGSEGAVVVPGRPSESALLRSLAADADPHMPPKGQLNPSQIQMLHDWVKQGLPWPETSGGPVAKPVPIVLMPLPPDYQPANAIAVAPDARRLAVSQGGRIHLYDLSQTGFPRVVSVDAHVDAIQSLAWSADSLMLASGAFRQVRLWSADALKPLRQWDRELVGRVTALVFDARRSVLHAADGSPGEGGWVRRLPLSGADAVVGSFSAHRDAILDMVLSEDGSRLGTAGGDRLIKVWDPADGRETGVLEGHTAQVGSLAFNSNATQVVSGGMDRELRVWDIATKEKIISLGNHPAALSRVLWLGSNQSLLAAREDGVVLRYTDLKSHSGEQSSATGQEHRIGEVGSEPVLGLAVASGTNLVFASSQSGSVSCWTFEGKLISRWALPAPTDPTNLAKQATEGRVPRDSRPPARMKQAFVVHPPRVLGLSAAPRQLRLTAPDQGHAVQITALGEQGLEWDVTQEARFSSGDRPPFRIEVYGKVTAMSAGKGVLTAQYQGHRVEIPIEVSPSVTTVAEARPLTFLSDVLPVLGRAGCSAGACHAKPEGQNGFRLSVFSYDPKSDYHEIVKEARGRRVFPSEPQASLLIGKPMGLIPHEGGKRFEAGSEIHLRLARWMREGMLYSTTNEPQLQGITVFPRERRYRKEASQQLLVQARFSDGSVRDVTELSGFSSNDKEIARVGEDGLVRLGSINGQGVVVARYMGFVSDSQLVIPSDRQLPDVLYANLPRNNFIDELAYAQFKRLGLLPSETCTDAEFLRRAKLDAIGLLPTPEEILAFLSDPSPGKRLRLIEEVLSDPAYSDHWANKWADLLRPNPDRVGVKSIFTLDQWLRESFRSNKPYSEFVREILTAEGSNHRDGPAVIYRDRREPAELTTMFSQLFLGTRLECARCHHHPNEKWGQEDFYQLAAFFGPLKQKGAGLSPPISAGTETFYFSPGGSVRHPVTGEVMKPRPPDGPFSESPESEDPRAGLIQWLTTRENPFFTRAAVNRVWAAFFGRGLVDPVDDFRISNPCVNPALLDALAEDFARHDYDLQHLMRRIMQSRLYQQSSTPNEYNLRDTRNFSRAYRRRLPAEVLVDAVGDVTGVSETFAAMPAASRAMQTWSYKIDSHFMDAFGRPNSSSDCPCERDTQLSVVQSLHLMNSKGLQAKLSHSKGRVAKLAAGNLPPAQIVRELYLLTLSRAPEPTEERRALEVFAAPGATRQTAAEDVLWALLNSAEFVFNR